MTQQEFYKRYTYDIKTDCIGTGGFGSVYKAEDNYHHRTVAIKIAKVTQGQENIRLSREVEMVKKLPAHPNIAVYEECYTFPGHDGEYDFGIMQYYEEGSLHEVLKKNVLTFAQKQNILTKTLNGLQFLHNNGIIHRDLKPQNILIVKRGEEYIPKITDFGISKVLDINKSTAHFHSLTGAGTYAYSSPEQLGSREIRKNADLWSFGVIAYQLFAGEVPFNSGAHDSRSEMGRVEMMRQISSGVLPDGIRNIGEPWQGVIRGCLVVNPLDRVRNCEGVEAILKGEVPKTPPKEKPKEKTRKPTAGADDGGDTIFDPPPTTKDLTDIWDSVLNNKRRNVNLRKIMANNPTLKWDNGDLYKGEISNGLQNGMGVYVWGKINYGYFGDWQNGMQTGFGMMIAPKGDTIYNCPHSNFFIGNFVNGLKNGFGQCFDANGRLIYSGNFANDAPTDLYPMVFGDALRFTIEENKSHANVYIGSTMYGKREGKGVMLYPNGDIMCAQWKNGTQQTGLSINANGYNVRFPSGTGTSKPTSEKTAWTTYANIIAYAMMIFGGLWSLTSLLMDGGILWGMLLIVVGIMIKIIGKQKSLKERKKEWKQNTASTYQPQEQQSGCATVAWVIFAIIAIIRIILLLSGAW